MAELLKEVQRLQGATEEVQARLDAIELGMRDAIRDGVVAGMRELLNDDKALAGFWARGYRELTTHTSNNATQWIGRRILTAIAIAAFVGSVTWLVKSGNLK